MKANIEIKHLSKLDLLIKDISDYSNDSINGVPVTLNDVSSVMFFQNKDKITLVNNKIHISFDGYFKIYCVILPTKEYLDRVLEIPAYKKLLGTHVYYIYNNKVYKYRVDSDLSLSVDLRELFINNDSIISVCEKEYVSIYYLLECYINLCKLLFNSRAFTSCANKLKIDSELVYKRDLVWMAINVIKYLVDCEQYSEVERIIGFLTSCNGVCTNTNNTSNEGCGCS